MTERITTRGRSGRQVLLVLLALAALCVAAGWASPAARADGPKALLTTPSADGVVIDPSSPLTWTTVSGSEGHYLTIGRSAGAYDVLASGELPASQTAYSVPIPLPTDTTLYVRLYTKVSGAYDRWQDVAFTVQAGGKARFTAPVDGQSAVDTTSPITWGALAGSQGYYLTLGTSAGAHDLLASGELPASQTSYSVPISLPTGKIYARLYTKMGGVYDRWQDIVYTVKEQPLAALSVSGNQILAGGQPFRFHGVNRDSLTWGRNNWTGCGGDGNFTDTDFDRIKAWKATAVRLPLSQANWLGRRCDATSYIQAVDAAIAKANARGMYAIVDLHWSDVSGRAPCDASCFSGQQPMPDIDSAVFWQQVAQRYANRPGVIFDLYNEPHDVSWSCWRNGGCTTTSSPWANGGSAVSYTAVGMQQLLDVVRAQGANNLVLAAGLDWAYDLSGVAAGYALSGANVAYDTHIYTQFHNTVQDWEQHVGVVAATKPVTATEFGSADCSTNVTSPLLDWFQATGIGWTIWSWNAPGSCQQPSVLSNMNGTPLAGQGQLIHDRMVALGS
ncbi:glycoside hydrolase family 5 protein [Patulibacter sp. NPDC049589]|uniref:glycoside hydrolase family 5 protein n=1 Tax=Patulibacter sp. NPDC049589 TaxID=3154731 RepID=UPI003414B6C8